MFVSLALHAAVAGALHQGLDFRDSHAVVVADDGVLQAGSSHSELQGVFSSS